jgi:hypothetical protein
LNAMDINMQSNNAVYRSITHAMTQIAEPINSLEPSFDAAKQCLVPENNAVCIAALVQSLPAVVRAEFDFLVTCALDRQRQQQQQQQGGGVVVGVGVGMIANGSGDEEATAYDEDAEFGANGHGNREKGSRRGSRSAGKRSSIDFDAPIAFYNDDAGGEEEAIRIAFLKDGFLDIAAHSLGGALFDALQVANSAAVEHHN